MKFTHNGKSLYHVFSILSSIVPQVSTRPIHQVASIKIEDGNLICCATDLEVGVEIREKLDFVEVEGDYLFPVSQIATIIREYQDVDVTFEVIENVINITAKGEKFHFFVNIEDEFPDLPFGQYKNTISINREDFRNLISKVDYAVSNDQTKVILGGVMMETIDGKLKLAAADGHRMAFIQHKCDQDAIFERNVIPRKTLKILRKTLAGEGKINISHDENHIYFISDNLVLISRLIEGVFPDVESFIPTTFNATATVNRIQLIDAVKKSILVNTEKDQSILLSIAQGNMHMATYAASISGADFDIPVKLDGPSLDLVFNPRFLLEIIETLNNDDVVFSLISDQERVMIQEGELKSIIMPIAKQ